MVDATRSQAWSDLNVRYTALAVGAADVAAGASHARADIAAPLFPVEAMKVGPAVEVVSNGATQIAEAIRVAAGACASGAATIGALARPYKQALQAASDADASLRRLQLQRSTVETLLTGPDRQSRLDEIDRQITKITQDKQAAVASTRQIDGEAADAEARCSNQLNLCSAQMRAARGALPPARASGAGPSAGAGALGASPTGISVRDLAEGYLKYDSAKGLAEISPRLLIGARGGAEMVIGRIAGSDELLLTGLGRYAAANRWVRVASDGSIIVPVAIEGTLALVNAKQYGLSDMRTVEPAVGVIGTGAAAGAAVLAGGSAAVGAAAFGGGMLIGDGIDAAVGAVSGRSISDRWSDAAVGDELDSFNAKLDRGETLTAAEQKRLKSLQSPGTIAWESFKALFGR